MPRGRCRTRSRRFRERRDHRDPREARRRRRAGAGPHHARDREGDDGRAVARCRARRRAQGQGRRSRVERRRDPVARDRWRGCGARRAGRGVRPAERTPPTTRPCASRRRCAAGDTTVEQPKVVRAPDDRTVRQPKTAPAATPQTIVVPDLGDFADVEVIDVLVKLGDEVAAEQGLVTLETEKASMDVPAPLAGTVLEVKVKKGSRVSLPATRSADALQPSVALTRRGARSAAAAAEASAADRATGSSAARGFEPRAGGTRSTAAPSAAARRRRAARGGSVRDLGRADVVRRGACEPVGPQARARARRRARSRARLGSQEPRHGRRRQGVRQGDHARGRGAPPRAVRRCRRCRPSTSRSTARSRPSR